jgi:phosphatidylglycerophosphate synthase
LQRKRCPVSIPFLQIAAEVLLLTDLYGVLMNSYCAYIISPTDTTMNRKKLCGLYLLERNIKLLFNSGIDTLYLNLDDYNSKYYEETVKPRLPDKIQKSISFSSENVQNLKGLILPANCFIQQHCLSNSIYQNHKKDTILLEKEAGAYCIEKPQDLKRARDEIVEHIVKNTGGFIAQKLNKRISIPISLCLARTGIHPNFLTVFNFAIGIASAVLLVFSACTIDSWPYEYMLMALGGLFFQLSSVLDGVDGEVAKFTLRVSKLGAWLDTLSDNGTLILFLAAASYLNYRHFGGIISLTAIGILFLFLGIFLSVMFYFVRHYTESGSLVNFDKYFIQLLPGEDKMVRFALSMKYLIKKEMFSLIFFLICLAGQASIIMPLTTLAVCISTIVTIVLYVRYKKTVVAHIDG